MTKMLRISIQHRRYIRFIDLEIETFEYLKICVNNYFPKLVDNKIYYYGRNDIKYYITDDNFKNLCNSFRKIIDTDKSNIWCCFKHSNNLRLYIE